MSNDVEIWRDIPGYEGHYEVSSHGRVRSLKRRGEPRILATPLNGGYPYLVVRHPGVKAKGFAVHRLVALVFLGPRPAGQQVRHLDGIRTNNHLDNLRYGTASENRYDAVRHGTHFTRSRLSTRCPRGHEYSHIRPADGARLCRICINERSRLRMRRVRAAGKAA